MDHAIGGGQILPAEEHRHDNDHLPGSVVDSCILIISPDDTHHQDDRALFPDRIQEYLRNWLPCRRSDSRTVVLNREEQAQHKEPAEDRRYPNRHDNAYRSRHGSISSFFGHVRARIEAWHSVRRQTCLMK